MNQEFDELARSMAQAVTRRGAEARGTWRAGMLRRLLQALPIPLNCAIPEDPTAIQQTTKMKRSEREFYEQQLR